MGKQANIGALAIREDLFDHFVRIEFASRHFRDDICEQCINFGIHGVFLCRFADNLPTAAGLLFRRSLRSVAVSVSHGSGHEHENRSNARDRRQ